MIFLSAYGMVNLLPAIERLVGNIGKCLDLETPEEAIATNGESSGEKD